MTFRWSFQMCSIRGGMENNRQIVPYVLHGPGNESVRYNWHSAGSLVWPFPVLKYKYIFQVKYTESILSNSTRKLLWFEISKMLIAVKKNKFIVLLIVIFGTLSFPIKRSYGRDSE